MLVSCHRRLGLYGNVLALLGLAVLLVLLAHPGARKKATTVHNRVHRAFKTGIIFEGGPHATLAEKRSCLRGKFARGTKNLERWRRYSQYYEDAIIDEIWSCLIPQDKFVPTRFCSCSYGM
jgi:hypothetical protein